MGKLKGKRDWDLIKDGRYNMRAIMQRAYAYDFQERCGMKVALFLSWRDAKMEMRSTHPERFENPEPKPYRGNVLKALFLGNHPENRYRDSAWR